jgi:glycosyltransferase involved in cell wall biosynthesis
MPQPTDRSLAFSVVIPAYNRANYIGHTLDCIRAQELPPAEIIVVNDGSTDNTAAVVGSYGHGVRLINIPNGGAPGARDLGARESRSKFIAFCDSDDLWRKDHLNRLAALLSDHHAPFAFSNFVHFHGDVRAERSHFECDPAGFWQTPGRAVGDDLFVAELPLLPRILSYQAIFPSCTAMDRDYYVRVGGYNARFGRNVVEDLEFALRCTRVAPAGIDVRPTGEIRKHQMNQSGDWLRCLSGSIEILKYAQRNHDLRPEWHAMMDREIVARSLEAIDYGFTLARFDDMKSFVANVKSGELDWKRRMKLAVASMPKPLAKPLCDLLTGARR